MRHYSFTIIQKKASTAGKSNPWKVFGVMEPVTMCYLNPGIVVQPRFERNEPRDVHHGGDEVSGLRIDMYFDDTHRVWP